MSVDLRVIPRTVGPTEDEIIQGLLRIQGGSSDEHPALYEDPFFSSTDPSTLYVDAKKLPEYAASSSSEGIAWYRPTEYTDDPDYFKSTAGCGVLREGALNDAWLLGVFAAIALHPDNLIENLFVSDALHHFKQFGVYTCRFYKNCQWVHVTTDTRLPYSVALQEDELFPGRGETSPGQLLYGSSLNKNEVFVPFLEKAYAKLHGSYQVLAEGYGGNVSGKILEAFLDCTGGSVFRVDVVDEKRRDADGEAAVPLLGLWKRLVRYKKRKSIITAQLKQLSFNSYDLTPLGILKNRQYVVMHVKEVSITNTANGNAANAPASTTTLRFVKLRNVWGRGMWKGDWSNDDSKWEEHVQVEHVLRNDPGCEFSRSGTDGTFWMIWEDFLESFSELYVAHVFGNEDETFQYCVAGEWLGYAAAGAPSSTAASMRPGTTGPASMDDGAGNAAYGSSRVKGELAIERTKWSVLTDGDANWHRNPQYKLTVSEKTSNVLISLTQRDFRLFGGDNYAINLVILQEKEGRTSIVWEMNRRKVVAEAHALENTRGGSSGGGAMTAGQEGQPSASSASTSQLPPSTPMIKSVPEREIVKEELTLEPGVAYFIIPYTDHTKVEMEFFLRVFAPKPVTLECVAPVYTMVQQGKWRSDDDESGDAMSAGGPLCLQLNGGAENPSWCQNPQFWLRFKRMTSHQQAKLLATRSFATLKIIVRKTSIKSTSGAAGKTRQRDLAKEKGNLVGITVVRARPSHLALSSSDEAGAAAKKGAPSVGKQASISSSSNASLLRAQAKAPKTNFLGEIVEKPQWKSRKDDDSKNNEDEEYNEAVDEADTKNHSIQFPAPRLVVNPDEWCRISDYSSPIVACMYLRKLPKEWLLEDQGGLMIIPTLGEVNAEGTFDIQVDPDFPLLLDELPKFTTQSLPGEWTEATGVGCHLYADWKKNPKFYLHLKAVRPAKVKITLTRSELEWKGKCKRDAVGTMLGFYVFHGQRLVRAGEAHHNNNNGPGNAPTLPHNIIVNGRPWSETDFVPLHSVTSPPELILPSAFNEPYVIMPATYEPGKLGKFVLSVQCDTEFALSSEDP
ncbi:hypothetical protein Poli38472_007620 [Pythium oligandrum]|uniref:Calpain catalytic domain-containing protein n=1 Tax=Pythium oligandrum TaxID=41045 RepID=A0A8K1FRV3_PYTOL|nr:hypothetical protein Poli38472_007620 [Pythium oligandrum]|eukprot:TMW67948.1 hypothetical protein Poli38472_007620 [Pythium oligandrum]